MPFEIPESWEWCKVEDFAYVASGSTPEKSSFVEKGIPYLKMYNLRNQKIDFEYKPQYITEEVHNGKLQRSRTEVGDLIMNIVGPPLGKLAIIPPTLPQCNFNQAAVLIRPLLHKSIIVRYLFYYLSQMSEINSLQTRGNAGQDNISLTQCQNIRVPLPPLSEQERIIRKVEEWFLLIEEIEAYKDDLQDSITQVEQKILDLAIKGKLLPQDPNDEPAFELLKRVNPDFAPSDNPHYENIPFKIPGSWGWCKVEDIFELNPKNRIEDSTIIGFVPMECISPGFGYSHAFEEKKWRDVKKGYCHFQNGDIGIAKISPCFENRKSTIFYDLPNNMGAGTTELVILRSRSVCTEFYLYVFQSSWYIKEGTKYFKGVVGQQRVNKDIFTTLLIPVPPIEEQKRIVKRIKKIFTTLDEITEEL